MNPRQSDSKELLAAASLPYEFLLTKETANRLRWFGTPREPVLRPFGVDLNLRGSGNRVVLS